LDREREGAIKVAGLVTMARFLTNLNVFISLQHNYRVKLISDCKRADLNQFLSKINGYNQ
jgi:hypothetical protein